jgi:tRNA threonylcarbamoyladenosine biosynthesis protein TsaB
LILPLKVLAVDTSSVSGSLALLEDQNVLAEWTLKSALTHNRRLLKTIDFLLSEAGWTLDSLDGFAIASGPGSFTGLRIGMTTMKVLAWTNGKLYAAIPSLDALAHPFAFSAYPVCAIMDARKKEVYCAVYRPDGKGKITRESPYYAITAAALAEKISEPTIFCGDGWYPFKNQLKKKLGDLALEPESSMHIIRAASVGEIAIARFANGDSDDPKLSLPLYVRPSEAEIHYPHLAKKSSGKPEIS